MYVDLNQWCLTRRSTHPTSRLNFQYHHLKYCNIKILLQRKSGGDMTRTKINFCIWFEWVITDRRSWAAQGGRGGRARLPATRWPSTSWSRRPGISLTWKTPAPRSLRTLLTWFHWKPVARQDVPSGGFRKERFLKTAKNIPLESQEEEKGAKYIPNLNKNKTILIRLSTTLQQGGKPKDRRSKLWIWIQ